MKLGSKLFIVFSLVVILVCCLVGTTAFAYADYEDLSSDTIVNFNQLIKDDYNHNYTYTYSSGSTRITMTNAIGDSGSNKYYFKVIKSTSNQIVLYNLNTSNSITAFSYISANEYSNVYTLTNLNYFSISHGASETYSCIMLINLTSMFGSGFEPTLAQCNEIFTAEYYSYNTGTALYNSYFNSYAKGVSDTLSSFDVTYNNYAIGSGSSSFSNNSISVGTFNYDNELNVYWFTKVIGVYLGGTISKGTNFGYDFTFYIPDIQGESNPQSFAESFIMHFAYVDSTNNLVDIATSKPTYLGIYKDNWVGSFVLPIDTDTLYIYFADSTQADGIDSTQMFSFDSKLTFRSLNIDSLLKAQEESIKENYDSYYAEDGEGYNYIYNLGYRRGLEAETPYTFGYLMSSVIEAPLNAILDIFNFDFLGVNFKNVITLVMTLMIIISIVRLFMGGE